MALVPSDHVLFMSGAHDRPARYEDARLRWEDGRLAREAQQARAVVLVHRARSTERMSEHIRRSQPIGPLRLQGIEQIHWRTGTGGITSSTSSGAKSFMRRRGGARVQGLDEPELFDELGLVHGERVRRMRGDRCRWIGSMGGLTRGGGHSSSETESCRCDRNAEMFACSRGCTRTTLSRWDCSSFQSRSTA